LSKVAAHYILHRIAGVISEAEFRSFTDDRNWTTTTETSNERIRQALTSAFARSSIGANALPSVHSPTSG